MFNERLYQWIQSKWQVDRDDILNNDKPNKYSAYYWFQNYSFLQNKTLLRVVRALFDQPRGLDKASSDSFYGVKTSENGLFLYKSDQAEFFVKGRFVDYFLLFTFTGFITGHNYFLIMPFLYGCVSLPRKYAMMHFATYHAELLPHTEQVVFHKAHFFGKQRRIFVDIANLEKIQPEVVPSPLLWQMNMYEQEMIFRDMATKEIFVFDKDGVWNTDTLAHKLIN